MRILRCRAQDASPIHEYAVHFKARGAIGPHRAGFGQLFIVTEGCGWVAGADGVRHAIAPGEVAHIEKGEVHSKGSDEGMSALMVQMTDLVVHAKP